ncbi:hypothetical protein IWQ55_000328 [Labrenzia sp. EL_208]|nr:hypothetical protein [Labrenzia sp. EL_132]MBG6227136.1 hypothetical protein [Labrenzia sp. EL_208]
MRILGVDPGGGGALALLDISGELLAVEDMPVFWIQRGKRDKPVVNAFGVIALMEEWNPDICWFEKVGGMTGESASAAFNFGRAVGIVEGVLKSKGKRFEEIEPHVWKVKMKIRGKDAARHRASNRWIPWAKSFARKKDDGRAEAALIAEYGRLQLPEVLF